MDAHTNTNGRTHTNMEACTNKVLMHAHSTAFKHKLLVLQLLSKKAYVSSKFMHLFNLFTITTIYFRDLK